MESVADLAERARRCRAAILAMGASRHGAHVGGSLSCADILTVLYSRVLNMRPDEPRWPGRDWFILSKGHASAALYAVLAESGFFPPAECGTYGQNGSRLAGHPLGTLPGVDFPTGSLGHGLSLALGVALAAKRAEAANRVFVLLGDGELQEGTNWEAIMSAAQFDLDNLVAIVDRNGWQITGRTEERMRLEPLADRWRAFGWGCVEVDGHDLAELCATFAALPVTPGRPSVVIARTVKGRGVPMFEDRKKSHYVTLTDRLYRRAMAGLNGGGR